MSVVGLDFETYYDKEYSLSKMTTEAYIRDPRFEVILVSAKVDKNPIQWFSGTMQETRNWLQKITNWKKATLVAHNAPFDGFILNHHFNIQPKFYVDTMAMFTVLYGMTESVSLQNAAEVLKVGEKGDEVIRALGKHRIDFSPKELQSYADYCLIDTTLSLGILRKMLPALPSLELNLIHITVKMYCQPVLELDKELLKSHLAEVKKTKEEFLLNVVEVLGGKSTDSDEPDLELIKKMLMSNDKFAATLLHYGVSPPMKDSPSTGKKTYAFAKTDEGMQELLEHELPIIQILAASRLGSKSTIDETRTQRFISIAERGAFPFPVKYSGAKITHRWAGTDKINPQNLTRINKKKPKPSDALRNSIVVPDGYVIVAGDLSNIELRMALWVAGERGELSKIRRGLDLYRASAEEISQVPYDEVDEELRFVFKTVNLSGIYGVGYVKMHSTLQKAGVNKDLEDVKFIVNRFRDNRPLLVRAWQKGEIMLSAMHENQRSTMGVNNILVAEGEKGIRKPGGLYLPFPELCKRTFKGGVNANKESWVYFKREGRVKVSEPIYGAKVFQRCIQSMSRDLIGWQMVEVEKKYPVVGTVHDEIITLCRKKEVDECVAYMKHCMSMGPDWIGDLPLACEVGFGKRYGDC